ncbi:TPA_asm: coat protein [ssRNA phage Gerhypos.1_44]|uniref:Coat protein n=2 Tax=Leviviricetes TaxID=2842243 RepID=A0A8S5KYB2_9VIRU|nr:coat protein [ssRNA phage Gerhypos.1_44]QDH91484.1 MAG: hypothetical protein H1Bulk30243_000002 [Leviviridae sp.]DAD50037.1 TPA_asm: coat protein [ssRNA phage Gerhypos.1_44]
MLANTLTLTVTGATGSPFTLTRVNQDNYGSEYKYLDAIQSIGLKIRHATDRVKANPALGVVATSFNRHNLTLEHTIFATLTVPEKSATAAVTLRDGVGYGPTPLLNLWTGFNTLVLAVDDGVVVGDN